MHPTLSSIPTPTWLALSDVIPASWGTDAASIGLLVAGIVLWLVGGRLMKAASVVTFAMVGAVVGFAAPAEYSIDLHPFLTSGLGLVLGAFAGGLLFRFTMAGALALALGLAATVCVGVTRDLPARAPEATRAIDTSRWFASTTEDPAVFIARSSEEASPRSQSTQDSALNSAVHRVVGVVLTASDDAEARWNTLESDDRTALRLGALAGIVFGFGIGLIAPLFAGSVVTSAIGVGLVLATGASLAVAHELPFVERIPDSTQAWAVLWLALTAVGALLQCAPSGSKRSSRRPRGVPKPEAQPGAAS